MTLFVVPVAYSLFSRWQKSKHGKSVETALPIALVIWASLSIPSLSHADAPLRLSDAVIEALEKAPQLRQSRERVKQGEADVSRSLSTLFPVINANLTGTSRKDAVLTGFSRFNGEPYNIYLANIQATQPIYMFGFFSALGVVNTDLALRLSDLEITERELTLSVMRAFQQVLLSQKLVESLTEIGKVQKEALATAQKRQNIGRGQLLDVLQAKTQLALLEPRMAQARTQLQIAAQELSTLLGRREAQTLVVAGRLSTPKVNALERELLAADLGNLPELEQAALKRERVDQQRQSALGAHLPSVRAQGEFLRQSFTQDDLLNPAADAWSVGVTLTIPLFSGLSMIHERHGYLAQARQAEAEEQSTLLNAALERSRSQDNLKLARQKVESSERALEISNASLDEARRNYRLATIDFLQFLQVQQAHLDAQLSLDQARFDHLQALAKTTRAVGRNPTQLVESLSSE